MTTSTEYFIAGTDTNVGKTFVSCALLRAAKDQGLSTAAVKPLAAGAIETEFGLRNDDALALQAACSLELGYEQVNPICLPQAMAPHIAAKKSNQRLSLSSLASACERVIAQKADFTLIEGAGGWQVPLNDSETLAGLPMLLNIPVILVVGMRLGCLNHALLSAQAIQDSGVELAGWIANKIDPDFEEVEENITSLQCRFDAPLMATVSYCGVDMNQQERADCFAEFPYTCAPS